MAGDDQEQDWLRLREGGVEVRVRLMPRASRDRVSGLFGDRLKIALTAPPVGGQANRALVRFVAKAAGVAPSTVRVVVGEKDRSKLVLVSTDRRQAVAARLRALLEQAH